MKNIYLVVAVFLMASCDSQTKKSTDNADSSETSAKTESTNMTAATDSANLLAEVDSTTIPLEDSIQTESNSEILESIATRSFEWSAMKLDSINEYGAGDCWGKIKKYSSPNMGLAIDSSTCGEYGFTYTYYLLSDKGTIQAIYEKKSESLIDDKTDLYIYRGQEQIIDFNANPTTVMTKVDTVKDYKLKEKLIDKKYFTESLKDKQTTYERLEKGYQETWEMEVDDY